MEKSFKNFIEEAELFFVTKFITSPTIEKEFSFCLDVLFNINGKPEIDYNKGIFAYNPKYGQSKSFFFDVVHHRCKRIDNINVFKKTTAKELALIYVEKGEEGLLEAISVRNLFIDDIGDEGDGNNKTFQRSKSKNTLNVIRYVLLKRYELWIKKGYRTFGTTNLTIKEIGNLYDGRVADRLMQMVYFEEFDFLLDGQSFRQIAETRQLTQEEIQANLDKSKVMVVEKEIDPLIRLNELLREEEGYLQNMHITNWDFVKVIMLERGFIDPKELEAITEDNIEGARLIERKNARDYVNVIYKNAVHYIRDQKKDEAYAKITRKRCIELAENIIVKNKFLTLKKKENFVFE